MTDQELRALVRDAVQRHLGPRAAATATASALPPAPIAEHARAPFSAPGHSSHALYISIVNSGDACVIEPAVKCDHCRYCKSHGH
jgi:hypothetical protein